MMKEGTKTLSLRIAEDLKLQLEIEAEKQNRSVNNLLTNMEISGIISKLAGGYYTLNT